MTDAFYAATAINGHDPGHAPPPHPLTFAHNHRFGAPAPDGVHEDDGQISCFCGYSDDDGNTVACDLCNRWQHTICYYPQYEGRELPVDLDHYCIDCRPHTVDASAANARQRRKREQHEVSLTDNGSKRQVSKSHKKKVKEPNGVFPYTNGWPLDKSRHDRNSASPRDQPPPAKRPKTVHRTSDSATNSTKGHSRKRTATNAHRRSLSRSPESPIGLYSEEFLRCYRDDQWSVSHANVMDELRVTNALSKWLQADDETFFELHGTTKPEVLNRWDGELDDIPGKVPLELQDHSDPNYEDEDGNCPAWKSVTVQDSLATGAYIGEVRGRIGFKDEYKTDTTNRWPTLRHPEPFVFFHPRLPIYIDARHEGTELRYILVTNGTDYHFCFMATTQIDPGMEVAVGWDTTDSILRQSADAISQISQDDMAQLSTWVSTVLANCGPCACQLPAGVCNMSRFDRRRSGGEAEDEEAQSLRLQPKSKKKKTGHHISPLNTHALNSRSGSEVRKVEPEDEPTDSRSVSGSAGRASDSRDNTPNTHYSANGSLSVMPELSERERKKLAKEEEMFRRQEEEQSGKQAKRKRHSAGSTATTPGPTSSKPPLLAHNSTKYADAGTSRQDGAPQPTRPKLSAGKRGRSSMLTTPVKSSAKTVPRPKPVYADASTQCDLDEEEEAKRALERAKAPKKRYLSLTQRLLQRCAVNNTKSSQTAGTRVTSGSSGLAPTHAAPSPVAGVANEGSTRHATAKQEPSDDVSMPDAPPAEADHAEPLPQPKGLKHPPEAAPSRPPIWLQPTDPPAPPWPPRPSPTLSDAPLPPEPHPRRPPHMHLPMPPPQANPFAAVAHSPTTGSGYTPPSTLTGGASFAQSPASLPGPLFSPAVTAAMALASPAKKKMSLSDYTKRKKDVVLPGDGAGPSGSGGGSGSRERERESPLASVASGPGVPGLLHSGSQVGGSQAVEEEDVELRGAEAGGP
ncbi:SET domain-containing protein 3 [Teratosphaeriaceae sp. CCFEE 6253]|nr:SET domain-containing protein 3 [Teratosphaeriaceae sp. CCFEE 6253]